MCELTVISSNLPNLQNSPQKKNKTKPEAETHHKKLLCGNKLRVAGVEWLWGMG